MVGHRMISCVEVEVLHQLPDHATLLVVLLTEERAGWTDKVQQFGHDRGHALKMRRSLFSLPSPGKRPDGDGRLKILRVQGFQFWNKDEIDVLFTTAREILRQISRIATVILGRAELERVHEKADHDRAARSTRALYQRPMAGV